MNANRKYLLFKATYQSMLFKLIKQKENNTNALLERVIK